MLLGMPALVPVEARLHTSSARHEPDTYEVIRDRKGGVFSSVDQRYKDGYLPGKVAYYNALKPYFKNLELKLIERGGSYVIFLENPTGVMDAIEESECLSDRHRNISLNCMDAEEKPTIQAQCSPGRRVRLRSSPRLSFSLPFFDKSSLSCLSTYANHRARDEAACQ